MRRTGLPPLETLKHELALQADGNGFSIILDRNGQRNVQRGFQTEYTGELVQKMEEQVRRLQHSNPRKENEQRIAQQIQEANELLRSPALHKTSIDSLIVTLPTGDSVQAIRALRDRISPSTCVTLLQNGTGVYDQLCRECWPDASLRPQFILSTTSHGVATLANTKQYKQRHILHSGHGQLQFGCVPDPRNQVHFDELLWPNKNTLEESRSFPTAPSSPRLPLPALNGTTDPRSKDNVRSTLELLLSLDGLSPSLLPIEAMHQVILLKLAVNCIINPITAIHDCKNGALNSSHHQGVIKALSAECSAVILAHLRSIYGRTRPDSSEEAVHPSDTHPAILAPEITELFSPASIQRQTLLVINATAQNISSMLGHVSSGKSTEIDFINGSIVKMANAYNIPVPLNTLMVDWVRARSKLVHKELKIADAVRKSEKKEQHQRRISKKLVEP